MPVVELQAQALAGGEQRQHGVRRRRGGEGDAPLAGGALEGAQRVAPVRVEQLQGVAVALVLGHAGLRGTRASTSSMSAAAAPIRQSVRKRRRRSFTPASSSWSARTGVIVIVSRSATSSTGR